MPKFLFLFLLFFFVFFFCFSRFTCCTRTWRCLANGGFTLFYRRPPVRPSHQRLLRTPQDNWRTSIGAPHVSATSHLTSLFLCNAANVRVGITASASSWRPRRPKSWISRDWNGFAGVATWLCSWTRTAGSGRSRSPFKPKTFHTTTSYSGKVSASSLIHQTFSKTRFVSIDLLSWASRPVYTSDRPGLCVLPPASRLCHYIFWADVWLPFAWHVCVCASFMSP